MKEFMVAVLDIGNQWDVISNEVVNKHNLPTMTPYETYSLVWLSKNKNLCVRCKCKVMFVLLAYYINEVEFDFVPLDVCGVIFANQYMWDWYFICRWCMYQFIIVKYGQVYSMTTQNDLAPLVLVSTTKTELSKYLEKFYCFSSMIK